MWVKPREPLPGPELFCDEHLLQTNSFCRSDFTLDFVELIQQIRLQKRGKILTAVLKTCEAVVTGIASLTEEQQQTTQLLSDRARLLHLHLLLPIWVVSAPTELCFCHIFSEHNRVCWESISRQIDRQGKKELVLQSLLATVDRCQAPESINPNRIMFSL